MPLRITRFPKRFDSQRGLIEYASITEMLRKCMTEAKGMAEKSFDQKLKEREAAIHQQRATASKVETLVPLS